MKIRDLQKFILYILALFTLVAPLTIINKIALIAASVLFVAGSKKSGVWVPKSLIAPASAVFLILLYGLSLSVFNPNSDFYFAAQMLTSLAVLPVAVFLYVYRIIPTRLIFTQAILFSLVTLLYIVALKFNAQSIIDFLSTVDSPRNPVRDLLLDDTATYSLISVPFLFLPWSLLVEKLRKQITLLPLILFFLLTAVLLISGRRGLYLAMLLLLIFVIFESLGVKKILALTFPMLVVTYAIIQFSVPQIAQYLTADTSNFVKVGHITSFWGSLTLERAIFGEGLGAIFFSSGLDREVAHTEIVPLDLVRFVGLPLAVLVYISLIYPLAKLLSYDKGLRFITASLAIYLLISFSNPVVFNSYGMLTISLYWAVAYDRVRRVAPANVRMEAPRVNWYT